MMRQLERSSRERNPSRGMPSSPSVGYSAGYPTAPPQDEHGGSANECSVVFDMIEGRQWKAVVEYLKVAPQSARATIRSQVGSSSSNSSSSANLPLHEACRWQPPLHVVNYLLELNEDAVRTPGQGGYLPLHIACGTGASIEVVAKLLEIYPAATRCRDDVDDALPIHLAARFGSAEDVLMEILTTHPEGSFMRDAKGNTPLDYAKVLPEGPHKRSAISSLETAPILVATAKAAARRVQREMESRMKGLKDAHAEFIRQLEDRQDDEKTEFLKLEVRFHNDLAEEKERNCELTEVILGLQKREMNLNQDKEAMQQRLSEERNSYQSQLQQEQSELRTILDAIGETDAQGSPVQRVSHLAANYQQTQSKLAKVEEDLKHNEDMVHHLNQLLTAKDNEISLLKTSLAELEQQTSFAKRDLEKMQGLQKTTEQELNSARNEMNRLQRKTDSQLQQLQDTSRLLHVQENRMGSIKNLVASLSHNLGTWDEDGFGHRGPSGQTPRQQGLPTKQVLQLQQQLRGHTLAEEIHSSTDHNTNSLTAVRSSFTPIVQGIENIKLESRFNIAQNNLGQRSSQGAVMLGGKSEPVTHNNHIVHRQVVGTTSLDEKDETVGLEVTVPAKKISTKGSLDNSMGDTATTTKAPDFDADEDMSTISQMSSPARGIVTIRPVD